MYNPKIKDYLKDKPDKTLIGLFWAGWWRLMLVIYGAAFGLGMLTVLADSF